MAIPYELISGMNLNSTTAPIYLHNWFGEGLHLRYE
jgi:hypothetical protein